MRRISIKVSVLALAAALSACSAFGYKFTQGGIYHKACDELDGKYDSTGPGSCSESPFKFIGG